MDKQQLLKDVTFANWNNFYNDLFEEINAIRKIGNVCLFNAPEVKVYYSRVYNLLVSVSFAVNDYQKKNKQLKVIGDELFKKDISKLNTNKIYYMLSSYFSAICYDLSRAGLLPKVNIKKKYNPGDAVKDMQ